MCRAQLWARTTDQEGSLCGQLWTTTSSLEMQQTQDQEQEEGVSGIEQEQEEGVSIIEKEEEQEEGGVRYRAGAELRRSQV